MKSYITSIGTAVPEYRFDQMKIAGFMAKAAALSEEERRKLFAIYKVSGIQSRYSVIPDFEREVNEFEFFPKSELLEPFPTVADRMKLYEKKALSLSLDAISNCFQKSGTLKEEVTHLITVSCTGMYAPGLDIEITQALKLNKHIQRTCINFMGCYAAFNALKLADSICKANPESKVLIVCLELCTIHYQKKKDWDCILSNALFSDGAAAVMVEGKAGKNISLSLEGFFCDIAFSGSNDMAWKISNHGFEMVLSSYVPDLIQQGIGVLAVNALLSANLESDDVDYYAIHPGGKRILQVIEEELSINREKSKFSHEVLRDYGNMSSPTVLFVMEKIMNDLKEKDSDKTVLGFAFGPGLTMESMVLKTHVHAESKSNESKVEGALI